jgi:hypothetical protein
MQCFSSMQCQCSRHGARCTAARELLCVQEMPSGMHGIFPVLHDGKVHIAGGGTEASYSQSTLHFTFGSCGEPEKGAGAGSSSSPSHSNSQINAPATNGEAHQSESPSAASLDLPAMLVAMALCAICMLWL